uniref:Uncharacterized protein n=1 Tax=Peronospora matthiolae TaxID=2874970 RepID=A0AAV1VAX0_9STRA
MQIDEDERLRGTIDSGFFVSALGRGMGVKQPGDLLFQLFGPQSVHDSQRALLDHNTGLCASVPPEFEDVNAPKSPMQQAPAQEIPLHVLDACQRKLAIRKFDGTELYQGLGSGFADWGSTSLRQVTMAQQACEFA